MRRSSHSVSLPQAGSGRDDIGLKMGGESVASLICQYIVSYSAYMQAVSKTPRNGIPWTCGSAQAPFTALKVRLVDIQLGVRLLHGGRAGLRGMTVRLSRVCRIALL